MTTRRGILAAALLLTAIAFLGSLGHVYGTVNAHDGDAPVLMTAAIALMPEVTVALVLWKLLTQGPRQPVAWFVGATAMVFSAAANASQRADGGWGLVVALWPAWSSVGAMLLLHTRTRPTRAELAEQEAARQRQADEDARRTTAAQEEANRLEAERQRLEREALDLRERELAEQEAQRKASERQQHREQPRQPQTAPAAAQPADAVDSLEPVVWEIVQERQAAGLGRIARDTPKAGTPLGLKDELKKRGYPGVGNARAGALLKKVYGDAEVRG